MHKYLKAIAALCAALTAALPVVCAAADTAAEHKRPAAANADGWHITIGKDESPTLLFVNGSLINAEVIIENGRSLVPLRVFAETLGADVWWLPETKTVRVTDTSAIELRIGDSVASVNDTPFMLPVAPRLVDSVTYVPLAFIARALDANVEYYDGFSAGGGYIGGVKHVMVSRYPAGTKPMDKADVLIGLRARAQSYNERQTLEKAAELVEIEELFVEYETDRYYKAASPGFEFLADKYRGDCYRVITAEAEGGGIAIITEVFDPAVMSKSETPLSRPVHHLHLAVTD